MQSNTSNFELAGLLEHESTPRDSTEHEAFSSEFEAIEGKPVKRRKSKAFENDSLEVFYEPVDSYEGRHRYDPSFEWEEADEVKVVRKV